MDEHGKQDDWLNCRPDLDPMAGFEEFVRVSDLSWSLIVPLLNERENLDELARRLERTVDQLGVVDVEIILVSDGSTDGTNARIAELCEADCRYRGLLLSRRFGHQAALAVGLRQARGECIGILDGDLQDPPELFVDLARTLDAGADVAYAVRRHRREGLFKKLAYAGFYRLLAAVADVRIPRDAGDFCLMRRVVVDAMLELPERPRFLRGLRAWVGYEQRGVPYDRPSRQSGSSKYGWQHLIRLACDGLFGMSTFPVRAISLLGLAVSGLAGLGLVSWLIGSLLWQPASPPSLIGFAILSIWGIGGMILLGLGVVGEYLVRGWEEAQRRPPAIIRRQIGLGFIAAPESQDPFSRDHHRHEDRLCEAIIAMPTPACTRSTTGGEPGERSSWRPSGNSA